MKSKRRRKAAVTLLLRMAHIIHYELEIVQYATQGDWILEQLKEQLIIQKIKSLTTVLQQVIKLCE
jgi:hypothetical protein